MITLFRAIFLFVACILFFVMIINYNELTQFWILIYSSIVILFFGLFFMVSVVFINNEEDKDE